MKAVIKSLFAVILGGGLIIVGCAKKEPASLWSFINPEMTAQLKSFVAEKEAQANGAKNNDGKEMPPEFKLFFLAAAKGDWLTASNMFENFQGHAADYQGSGDGDERLRGPAWETVKEVWGALNLVSTLGGKFADAYSRAIIDSIPPGSIYFGGTDPGRFLITGMEKSQIKADPFFLLTQNALTDPVYLDYLHSMYGGRIYVPTPADSAKSFQDYVADANKRLQANRLRPGEDVSTNSNGTIQVSGQLAVMEINGFLAKTIFDKNPDREFFLEESFPLDWMYPYLEPHGLILKINRKPFAEIPDDVVSKDQDYWVQYLTPMIGSWLNNETSVTEVAAFVEKTYPKHDLEGFEADPQFVRNPSAQKLFSKLRNSIADVYKWRAEQTSNADEKKLMNAAADFAFRQAWALCPYSPEVVVSYVNFLLRENRSADALLIAETAAKFPSILGSDAAQFKEIAEQLNQYQNGK